MLAGALLGRAITAMAAGDPAVATVPGCSSRLHAASQHFLDAACRREIPDAAPASDGPLACNGKPSTDFAPAWYYLPLRHYRTREIVPEQWRVAPAPPNAWTRDEAGLHRAGIRAQRQFRHALRFRFDTGGVTPLQPASEVVSPTLDGWLAQLHAARNDPVAMRWLSWSIRTRGLGCAPEELLDRWIHRAREMQEDARDADDGARPLFAAVAYVGDEAASIVHYVVHTGTDGFEHLLIVDSMPAPSTLLDPFGDRTVHNGMVATIHHMSAVAAEKTDFRSVRVGMSLRVNAEAMREAGFVRDGPDDAAPPGGTTSSPRDDL